MVILISSYGSFACSFYKKMNCERHLSHARGTKGTLKNGLFAQLFVTLKILSSGYQLYACGKFFVWFDFERKPSFFKAPKMSPVHRRQKNSSPTAGFLQVL